MLVALYVAALSASWMAAGYFLGRRHVTRELLNEKQRLERWEERLDKLQSQSANYQEELRRKLAEVARLEMLSDVYKALKRGF